MNKREPVDVVDVTQPTRASEPDRLDFASLALAVLALVTGTVELIDPEQAARFATIPSSSQARIFPALLVLAHEPLGELERFHPLPLFVVRVPGSTPAARTA